MDIRVLEERRESIEAVIEIERGRRWVNTGRICGALAFAHVRIQPARERTRTETVQGVFAVSDTRDVPTARVASATRRSVRREECRWGMVVDDGGKVRCCDGETVIGRALPSASSLAPETMLRSFLASCFGRCLADSDHRRRLAAIHSSFDLQPP